MRRPNSVLGLTARLVRIRWARLGTGGKIAVVAALIVGGVALASAGRCLLGASTCPASAGCPTSSANASPCGQ